MIQPHDRCRTFSEAGSRSWMSVWWKTVIRIIRTAMTIKIR